MELASGHSVHLQPECSAPAVVLKLPQALKQALAAAQRNGERVVFRCSRNGNNYQATLCVGISQHLFTGVGIDKQTVLRLSTLDDVPGAVVANIGCKLHQQKELHNSNIGSRIRASAQAEKQGRGQTQVLDRVPAQNGHSKAYRSVTPPAVAQRALHVQPRPKTPPPALDRSHTAAAVAGAASRPQAQTQAARLAGRSLTPPNSRPATPPPARQQQQQQQGPAPQQQPLPQQQPRPQPKPVSREPPKPRSLSNGKQQQQQQRRTSPPASMQPQQQQQQQRPAGANGSSRLGSSVTPPPTATESGTGALQAQAAPAAIAAGPRPSPAPVGMSGPSTHVGSAPVPATQAKQPLVRTTAGAGSTAGASDKAAVQRSAGGASRPVSRGASPAFGSSAAAKQQQARSAMPLISVQPLPQAPKPAGDRRSPAPASASQQQPQQPPQRSRLQQGSNSSRPLSAAAAAGVGSKQQVPTSAAATAQPSSVSASQQSQQQAKKRPASSTGASQPSSAIAAKPAKMRRLNEIVAPKANTSAAGAVAAGVSSQALSRKSASQQQQQAAKLQAAQPQRRLSPPVSAVGGQRHSPDGSMSSAGASPSQQQQHTKHWFTSSEESGEVGSVGDATVDGAKGTATAAAAGTKRRRDLDSTVAGVQPTVAATASTAQQSWAAAIQAKKQQGSKPAVEPPAAARPKSAVDPAAAKSSWQAALKRQSPPHQATPAAVPAVQSAPSAALPGLNPAPAKAAVPAAATSAKAPAAKAPVVLDLGPPGYKAFVEREPRSFAPISRQQQYQQYATQYENQYSMYVTLNNCIEAHIRSVKEAHAKMAAEALGSPAHVEAKQQLQQQLTSKAELTQRWNIALRNLHTELAALKVCLRQWIVSRRPSVAAAAQLQPAMNGVPATADHHVQQQPLGGKGFMLAASHGLPPTAVVGA